MGERRETAAILTALDSAHDVRSQPAAAECAAAFAFEVLAALDLADPALDAGAVDHLVAPAGDGYPVRDTPGGR